MGNIPNADATGRSLTRTAVPPYRIHETVVAIRTATVIKDK